MAVSLIRTWVASAQGEPDRPAVLEVEENRWFTRGEILGAAMRAAQWLDRSVPEAATVLLHGPGGALVCIRCEFVCTCRSSRGAAG